MIRDRLVVGIQNFKLSEQLQTDPNLTLEKAKKLICQSEAVQEHQAILQQAGNSVVEQTHHKKDPFIHPPEVHKHNNRLNVSTVETNHMLSTNVLQRSLHATNARGKASTVASALKKTVLEVTVGQPEEDIDVSHVTYLSAIVSEKDSCWTVNIEIN